MRLVIANMEVAGRHLILDRCQEVRNAANRWDLTDRWVLTGRRVGRRDSPWASGIGGRATERVVPIAVRAGVGVKTEASMAGLPRLCGPVQVGGAPPLAAASGLCRRRLIVMAITTIPMICGAAGWQRSFSGMRPRQESR